MATTKQIGYIKRLMKDKNIQADVDFDKLSGKEASEMIDRLLKQAETAPPQRPNQSNNTRFECGMCFKLAHEAACDSDGSIPEKQKENFKQTVTGLVELYRECLNEVGE